MRITAPFLLLALLSMLTGCVCPPWICGFDDDDRVREGRDDDDRDDDDIAAAADDDDDDALTIDALSFTITLDVQAPVAGDDDDSAGDDDDSAGDDDDSAASLPGATAATGTLVTRYWADWDGEVMVCEQHVAFDADVFSDGAPDCDLCSGFIQISASSVRDVSNPVIDGDHCGEADLEAMDANFGVALLRPAGVGGLGDFISIALVDAATGIEDGLQFAPDDGLTYAEQAEALDEQGMALSHGGYLRSTPDGLVEGAGIDQIASTPDGDGEWFAFWRFFRDPALNSWEGADLRGRYAGQSVWIVFPR